MTPHKWVFNRRGVDLQNSPGEPGAFHVCEGCAKEVFFLDKWNDFQKQLTIATAWLDDVFLLSKEELDRRTRKTRSSYTEIGFHGQLAEDCDLAKEFVAEIIMIS